jgi:hypothetical protein
MSHRKCDWCGNTTANFANCISCGAPDNKSLRSRYRDEWPLTYLVGESGPECLHPEILTTLNLSKLFSVAEPIHFYENELLATLNLPHLASHEDAENLRLAFSAG